MRTLLLLVLLLSITLTSCVTRKKLSYLQSDNFKGDTMIVPFTPTDYKVLSYDNLFIRVVTPDPRVSEIFNALPSTSNGISVTEQSADLISYPVDGNGEISLPYIGKLHVEGKTLTNITDEVSSSLRDYIADPAVTVKMVNNYVSLLGEVNRPGKYPIYKDRLSIFQALAMGGDLTDFSDRQMIRIIRPTTSGNRIKEFALTDMSIMESEFLYVMPNDVIYAKPMKGRIFQMNEFPFSLMLSTITTFILMYNYIK